MITVADFRDFFAAVNDGAVPYAWQKRLLEEVSTTGRWPDRIVAPTGSGKSSVVDIHLFAVALYAAGAGVRVPRRLAVVVNRRALVDRHSERSAQIAHWMAQAPEGTVLEEVSRQLEGLRTIDRGVPFDQVNLRGGVALDRSWLDDPCSAQVICATPDMWGSRILFRGYGASRLAAPRAAGLLAVDSVMVLDEAHLNRQLLQTARRISTLLEGAPSTLSMPGLQVVETTATPGRDAITLTERGVDEADLDEDAELRRRLTTPKRLTRVESSHWPPGRSGRTDYLVELADQTLRLHKEFGRAGSDGRTVGCFVNTVSTALEISAMLRKHGVRVATAVGRMRPHDRRNLPEGLLTPAGNPDVDVLVATQTLEVGVDLDLAAAVSELADAQALAQRSGRVNRTGSAGETEFVVVGPDPDSALFDVVAGKETRSLRVPPYALKGHSAGYDHLARTWSWLGEFESSESGICPMALTRHPPEQSPPRRTLLQRLELNDTWLLARTDGSLLAEPDIGLWLRDALDSESASGGLAVRELPQDTIVAVDLLRMTPPVTDEIYPASLHDLRKVVAGILDSRSDGTHSEAARAFVFRAGSLTEVLRSGDSVDAAVWPGDVVVVDDQHKVCASGVVVASPTHVGSDAYESGQVRRVRVFDRPDSPEWVRQLLHDLGDLVQRQAEPDPHEVWAVIADYAEQLGIEPATESWLPPDWGSLEHPSGGWILIQQDVSADDDTVRQTRSENVVQLEAHSSAVADRARCIAESLRLPDDIVHTVQTAGLWHDEGKRDHRFQRFRLINFDRTQILAKSPRTPRRARQADFTGGLATGWRHEQLSALLAATAGVSGVSLRLIGTSHGYGRPGFPHSAHELLDSQHPEHRHDAIELFDAGAWDSLIDATDLQWTVWGTAYLEAIVRAADCQVSQEGR
ncbi:type I-G CRISPR-associated helicase/endonuclease Cas3g [Nocardia thailandica]